MRPIVLFPPFVNHRAPSGPAVILDGRLIPLPVYRVTVPAPDAPAVPTVSADTLSNNTEAPAKRHPNDRPTMAPPHPPACNAEQPSGRYKDSRLLSFPPPTCSR